MVETLRYRTVLACIATALLGVLAVTGPAGAAEVQANLSALEAYVGMPVYLRVQIDNAATHQPPRLPDIDGVTVRSAGVPSRSSQTTIINGQVSQRTSLTYAWALTPMREGTFTVPALEVQADGKTFKTHPQTFTAVTSETGDLLFVEIQGNRKTAYVGESLTLRLKIWVRPYLDKRFDVRLGQADMWSLVSDRSQWGMFSEAVQELARQRRLPDASEQLRKTDAGLERSYYVYEIEHTVWPDRPGQLDASDVTVMVNYPTGLERSDGFFSRGELRLAGVRPIVKQASIEPIAIRPVPTAGRPDYYNGAVGTYRIRAQAQPRVVHAGEPVSLTLGIRGQGRLAALQAPPLSEMPELTRRFKVPDEPPAGVVEGDQKFFVVNLRPLDASVTEIPSIPMVYFEPNTETFKTVRTEPIPLVVKPARTLEMEQIVSANGQTHERAEASDETADRLAGYSDPAVLLAEPSRAHPWLMLSALLGPPLLFAGVLIGRGWLERWSHSTQARGRAARRHALQCLDAARDADHVGQCLLQYIADRAGLPAAAFTRGDADRVLRRASVPDDLHRQIDSLLERCQTHRYAGRSGGDIDALAEQVRQSIRRLEREVLQ